MALDPPVVVVKIPGIERKPIAIWYEAGDVNLVYFQRTRLEEYRAFVRNIKGIKTMEEYLKQRTII